MLVTGANGAGKTNLLEALHVGTQGFSPRTRSDAHLVHHDADHARVTVAGRREAVPTTVDVTLARHAPKRARLNGAPVRSAEHLRTELTTLVFTPDLPKTRSGKIMRRLLRDISEQRHLGDVTTLANEGVVTEIAEMAAAAASED